MKASNAVRLFARGAVVAAVMTAALGGAAWAAVSQLTIDPSAQLSAGRLHVYLTGSVTCDPGDTMSLSGRVVQSNDASGYGSTTVVCDGTQQAYTVDASTGGGFPGFPSGAFKPGKASAEVIANVCTPGPEPFPFPICTTTASTDTVIRLHK